MTAETRIGVDLGGTKIEIVALEPDGSERIRKRVATPAGDYEGTIATIARLITEVDAELGRRFPIGIGTPGAISPATGLIKNANSTVLIGKPLGIDLERAIGREIRLANDADCFALSEATDGAASGERVVFGVILGTGVGGGIVVEGALVSGPSAIAGEWGHNPLPWPQADELPGPQCYCGNFGCIETWLSGPSFVRDVSRGRDVPFKDAPTAIAAGAPLDRYIDRLGRSLATIVNVLDPYAIVLGGGMSNVERLPERATAVLAEYAFTDVLGAKIVRAKHGDSSGVRGAARLWH